METSPVGIPWYHEADYNGLREMFEDGNKLPTTYEEWLKVAEDFLEYLKGSGIAVKKVYIKPEEFLPWCTAHGVGLNSNGRIAFIRSFMARLYANQC